jgi:hypothetical protein
MSLRKVNSLELILSVNGQMFTDPQSVLNRWKNLFN